MGLIFRRSVIQVYERGARILDGSFMTQELSFSSSNSESNSGSEIPVALSVSIADPFVMLRMSNGSIRLLVGGKSLIIYFMMKAHTTHAHELFNRLTIILSLGSSRGFE